MSITSRTYVKVVFLGDSSTGKTCLMKRYFKNSFDDTERETIGAAFDSKILVIDGIEYQLCVWDTTGQEKYRSVCSVYYRGAKAAILCYDVRCSRSFRNLSYWINELRKFEPACLIYLCSTKADLLDEFEASPKLEIVQGFADQWNAKFFVTSAKTNVGIDEMFEEIVKDYISKYVPTPSSLLRLSNDNIAWMRRRNRCC